MIEQNFIIEIVQRLTSVETNVKTLMILNFTWVGFMMLSFGKSIYSKLVNGKKKK